MSAFDLFNSPEQIAAQEGVPACGNYECCCSSDPFDNLTYGWGKLDYNGYWEHECFTCARAFEIQHPEYIGRCIPLDRRDIALQGFQVYQRQDDLPSAFEVNVWLLSPLDYMRLVGVNTGAKKIQVSEAAAVHFGIIAKP